MKEVVQNSGTQMPVHGGGVDQIPGVETREWSVLAALETDYRLPDTRTCR